MRDTGGMAVLVVRAGKRFRGYFQRVKQRVGVVPGARGEAHDGGRDKSHTSDQTCRCKNVSGEARTVWRLANEVRSCELSRAQTAQALEEILHVAKRIERMAHT
jgi:hypothetical protein